MMNVPRFLLAHWAGAATSLALLLIGVVVLQNLEPVAFDVLFWSFPTLPKLVVILVSMAIGAVLAEVIRLLLRAHASAVREPAKR